MQRIFVHFFINYRLRDCESPVTACSDGNELSVCHLRKPGFEIYQLCAKEMGVELADCVSVADNVKRDIPGAKKAGVGCNIIFESPEKKHAVEFTEENRPDAISHGGGRGGA